MKSFFNGGYLDVLYAIFLVVMGGSVVYTLITDESPLESLGVSPGAAVLGTVILLVLLILAPRVWANFNEKTKD